MTASGTADPWASAYAETMMAFILRLRSRGLRDQRVLNAVSSLPRPLFVLPEHAGLAWADHALPIHCGQTITPPVLAATIAQRLEIGPDQRVLEIGTGSGYLTAVLARLAQRVLTLDRWRTLISEADQRLRTVDVLNVTMMVADGSRGWPEEGPFDRIVCTAALPTLDPRLVAQLSEDGRLVAPIGERGADQRLICLTKKADGAQESVIGSVRVTAIEPGVAEAL